MIQNEVRMILSARQTGVLDPVRQVAFHSGLGFRQNRIKAYFIWISLPSGCWATAPVATKASVPCRQPGRSPYNRRADPIEERSR